MERPASLFFRQPIPALAWLSSDRVGSTGSLKLVIGYREHNNTQHSVTVSVTTDLS